MAEVKNYGLSGVHRTLQLGKQGPVLVGNASTDSFTVTLQDAATLTTMGGANASSPEHFITKAQLDVVYTEAQFLANVNYNDSSPILLGNISAGVKTIITTFEVDTAFDGNAVITVGTGDDNSLLMSDSYAEIEVTGSYQTTGLFEFAADTSLNIYVTQGGATQGAGKVLVSVVDGPVVDGGTINYGGAGGGLTDVVSDTSPQLGGNLDLNSYEINGNGNVNILGQVRVNDGGSAGITINAPYILTGDPNTSLILTSDDTTNWIQIPGSGTADAVTVAHEGVNGVVTLKAGTNELQFVANGDLTVPNYINFKDGTFIGDEGGAGTPVFRIDAPLGLGINLTTDSNISGNNHTWSFSTSGVLTLPAGGDIVDSNGNSVIDVPTAVSELTNDAGYIVSNTTGITGADQVTNMVTLTQAEYNAITPNASTVYFIVG